MPSSRRHRERETESQEHLLSAHPVREDYDDEETMAMDPLGPQQGVGAKDRSQIHQDEDLNLTQSASTASPSRQFEDPEGAADAPVQYRVYKRRFFGLTQLVLLNVIVSWDWLSFSAISGTSAEYFQVSQSAINWLSTGFLFAFVAICPVTIWVLNKGPKPAFIIASYFVLVGNWVRFAGARVTDGHFGVVMFGQILIGLAQPFVLAAPTRYSDLWFTDTGRVSATAVASLANPLGGALGQLISPEWVKRPEDVPNMVLYTAIISTVAALPSFFVPAAPPTPPTASSASTKTPLSKSFGAIIHNRPFWIIFAIAAIGVGFFNAFSSLLNQIMEPYGFSEEEAGITGGLLIVVGLICSAIVSPIVDRTHAYLLTIKILTPVIALSFIAFIFCPPTRTLVAPCVVAAILGAACFSLVPVALEYLVEITWPLDPGIGSTIIWAGGQLFGGIFIIIMGALKDDGDGAPDGSYPPGNMQRALNFEAAIMSCVVPLVMVLGVKRLGMAPSRSRRDAEEERQGSGAGIVHGD
ncbi:MFS general substrate transporter [Aulographum hederae CBS 113979]|uniref:MFS general substrate transporter n=1 Tax=Aulographum hederae CBS 113979 TaxID=1176131 RepID=A0A6G1HG41_9PEZI|nr:MFS general substrate transporter [Aulographum hederae CBS 113979]